MRPKGNPKDRQHDSFEAENALGNGETLPEDEEIASSLLKASGQLTEDLKLTGTWIHYQNDSLNPNNPQSGSNITATNPLVDRFAQSDTVSAKLGYNPTGNPLIDSNLIVYWARHLNEEGDTTSARLTERKIETTGLNFDNRSRFDLNEWAQLTLTYGGEYYVDRQTGEDNAPLDGTTSNVPDADASYYGTFVQAEFDVTEPAGLPGELKLIPGVRWDGFENNYKDTEDYDDYEDTAISPKLGASYKPVPWFLMFGNYGSGFRAPSYTELYAQGTHFTLGPTVSNVFIPNPDLKPQEATTYEAGLGFDFADIASQGDRLTLKGSYWYTDAENFIDMHVETAGCFSPFGGCYSQFENIEQAELDGVEIEAKYDAARWYGSVGYTHIDGVDKTTGDYLGTLQPDKIVIGAGFKVPEIWSRFGTRVTFADTMDKVNAVDHDSNPATPPIFPIRDAYNLVDLYATFEPEDGPWKGFRLDLGIDNVTDEDYELVAAGASEEGINFKAAVSWTQKW